MATVRIEGLSKRFSGKQSVTAIDDMNLDIDSGEFLVLLGPSGCGKTTTLRCLAGLETPDAGRIALGNETVYDAGAKVNLGPEKRRIGMVFQSYALWPHMTVRKNIGYPLRARRVRSVDSTHRIEEMAALVDCGHLLDRYPAQLSGGQQQRVALARGLVAEPELLLFDEPLSNLDARLRDMVRAQLHQLHGRLGFTAVFVTHDQSEALALGDRLAIMRDGVIEQLDTPENVFEQPATDYVAEFIGMSNRVDVQRGSGGWQLGADGVGGELPVPADHDQVGLRFRPDVMGMAASIEDVPSGSITFGATVVDSQFGGLHMDVMVALAGGRLHARVPTVSRDDWARHLVEGQPVVAHVDPQGVVVYDESGSRITGKVPAQAVEDR